MIYLGKTLLEAEEMTLREYTYEMYAHVMRGVNKERDFHWQAWLNEQVKATKKQGKKTKPVFNKFQDFFNYEELTQEVTGDMTRQSKHFRNPKMIQALKRANDGV